MKNIKHIFYVLTWVINFLLVALVFASFDSESFRIYFNSDTLYLASIYKDLFIDGTGFSGWYLNAAPNFFPDMFLYFIINTLFSDFRTAYLVFSFVQYFLILGLLNVLLKTIIPKINLEYSGLLNLLFPVFLLAALLSKNFLYTYFIFSHSFHTGMFINALLAFIFFFKYLNSEKRTFLILTLLITFIGTYNDRLFLVMFTFPVTVVFILNFIFLKSRKLKIASLLVILSSFVSLILFKYTKINPVFHCIGLDRKYLNYDNILFSLNKLFSQHYNYVRDLRVQGFISITAILNVIILPVLIFKNYLKIKSGVKNEKEKQGETVFFTMVFFSILITLFSPALNGYYLGEAHLRYNIFSFYFGVFNIAIFLYLIFKEKIKYIKLISGALIIFYVGIVFLNFKNKNVFEKVKEITEFYPEKVKIIDDFAEKHNLRYGLSQYWDAKYTTMFSEKGLRVYTVASEKLNPWFHVMNKNWYFNYDKGEYNKPVFNFIILNKFDKEKIKNNFGKPLDSLVYKGETVLYVTERIKYDRKTGKPSVLNTK